MAVGWQRSPPLRTRRGAVPSRLLLAAVRAQVAEIANARAADHDAVAMARHCGGAGPARQERCHGGAHAAERHCRHRILWRKVLGGTKGSRSSQRVHSRVPACRRNAPGCGEGRPWRPRRAAGPPAPTRPPGPTSRRTLTAALLRAAPSTSAPRPRKCACGCSAPAFRPASRPALRGGSRTLCNVLPARPQPRRWVRTRDELCVDANALLTRARLPSSSVPVRVFLSEQQAACVLRLHQEAGDHATGLITAMRVRLLPRHGKTRRACVKSSGSARRTTTTSSGRRAALAGRCCVTVPTAPPRRSRGRRRYRRRGRRKWRRSRARLAMCRQTTGRTAAEWWQNSGRTPADGPRAATGFFRCSAGVPPHSTLRRSQARGTCATTRTLSAAPNGRTPAEARQN